MNGLEINISPPTTTSAPLLAEPYQSPGGTTMPHVMEKTSESKDDHEGSRIPILLPRVNKSDPLVSAKQPRRNSLRHKSVGAVTSGGKNSPRQQRSISRMDFSQAEQDASTPPGENGGKHGDDPCQEMQERPLNPKCLPAVPGLQGEGDVQPLNRSKTSSKNSSEFSTLSLSMLYNSESSAGGDTSHTNSSATEKAIKHGGSVEMDDDIMNEKFPEIDFCSTPRKNSLSLEDAETAEDVSVSRGEYGG